jgi:hypothetical protein
MIKNTDTRLLKFRDDSTQLREDLSVAVFANNYLWVASDETTSIERLSTKDGAIFDDHKTFPLGDLIKLPAVGTGFDQEIDIEGMAYDGNYLWIVGSHSIKRKNLKKEDTGSTEKKIKKLTKLESDGNRYLLARIPLIENEKSGEIEPRKSSPEATPRLFAAQLAGDTRSNDLTNALKDTDNREDHNHIGPFLSIPSKDNGFDIEGLAIAGDKIFIGLRGPVLRGWAIILEVSVSESDSALTLKQIGPDSQLYKKHFLQLEGKGIREMSVLGSDLLILAGPSMDMDGPVSVFRWRDAVNASSESLIWKEDLQEFTFEPATCADGAEEKPKQEGKDHPEGMTILTTGEHASLLIIYDSPADGRKVDPASVYADVFELPDLS